MNSLAKGGGSEAQIADARRGQGSDRERRPVPFEPPAPALDGDGDAVAPVTVLP
jgi:hypothetical protein